MVTVRKDGRIVCESSHLQADDNDLHVRASGVPPLWSYPCGDQEHLHDQTPADVWVTGACRHEHVVTVPLCGSCARSHMLEGPWCCVECWTAPPAREVDGLTLTGGSHECRVAIHETGRANVRREGKGA